MKNGVFGAFRAAGFAALVLACGIAQATAPLGGDSAQRAPTLFGWAVIFVSLLLEALMLNWYRIWPNRRGCKRP